MSEPNKAKSLRHDLAGPMSTILGEAQLLMITGEELSPEVLRALKVIEAAVLKMKAMLDDDRGSLL
jgi:signal transduction histidine kinase